METVHRPFNVLTFPSILNRAWRAAVAFWMLTSAFLTLSPVQAQGMYVGQVVPSQVMVGQVFTIQGQFPGMTSAAAYLSDGVYGLPLTILSVSSQQITARIDSIPWPMTGTLHVMDQEGVQPIPNQTWQDSGVSIDVTSGIQFDLTQVASGGVLTVVGSAPIDPPQVFAAEDNSLLLDFYDPCNWVTALILIEPDLDFPADPTLPVGPSNACNGIGLSVSMAWTNGTSESAFYNTVAAGLNQFLDPDEIHMTYDPNGGSSGNGSLQIELQGDCPSLSGAAVLLCE